MNPFCFAWTLGLSTCLFSWLVLLNGKTLQVLKNSSQKTNSHEVISRVFPSKFTYLSKQIDMISISGHCIRFIMKICQTVVRHKKDFRQLHEFWWFFTTWPNCGGAAAMLPCCHCCIGRRQAMRGSRRGAQACDHRFSICKAARQPAFKLFAASIFFP